MTALLLQECERNLKKHQIESFCRGCNGVIYYYSHIGWWCHADVREEAGCSHLTGPAPLRISTWDGMPWR